MTTTITQPGTYGAGSYYLGADISLSSGNALVFTGAASLDLNGHAVETAQTGNSGDIGIQMQGAGSYLYDSKGSGRVSGFRVGAKLTGNGSKVIGVNLSGNRYVGVSTDADDVEVIGGLIASLGGVTDEKYAIGVNTSGERTVVDGVTFRNIYAQARYTGTAAGEGVPVNLSSASVDGTVRNCVMINDVAEDHTIAIFAGSLGGHVIADNLIRNFWIGPASVSTTVAEITGNHISIDAALAGSIGISGLASSPTGNIVAGPFETPMLTASQAGNTVLAYPLAQTVSPPPPPPPPSSGEGAILLETHTGNFGNVEGATVKVRIAASALTIPTGTPSKIRLRLRATADEPLEIGSIYTGHAAASGAAWDAAALSHLLFSGQGGVTIATSGEVWTDWLTFAWDKSSDLIVSFYVSGDASADKMPAKTGTAHTTYVKGGADHAGTAVPGVTFGSYAGYLSAVAEIQTDGF